MDTLSVITPCYNEEEALPKYMDEMQKIEKTMPDVVFEYILVDDGSSDNTAGLMKELAKQSDRIKYISFSRNFGKEAALYAGLKHAKGDFVVIMDADLQDPPSLLPEMYTTLTTEDYDCVATRRSTRKGEPKIRSFFANKFYQFINKVSKTNIVNGARDFRMMNRKMVDALMELGEYNRFSKGLFSWVGFKTQWISYENVERVAGDSKWSFWKLLVYAIEGIVAFSTAPLAIASVIGSVSCLLAVLMALFYGIKALIWGDPVTGFPTLICVILLLGGAQLLCMGILGQYLSKTYLESKHRPIYICRDTNIEKEDRP